MYLGAKGKAKLRQDLEAKIVLAVIDEALRQGYFLAVDNGDDDPMMPTRDRTVIVDAIMETDDDYLHVYTVPSSAHHVGWIRFIYGNDGYDVISDYLVDPEIESILIPANKIASEYD